MFIPFSSGEKHCDYEELDINNVCALNLSTLFFFIGKITTETLMHSLRG